MSAVPPRRSRVFEAVEALKQDISNGDYTEFLPGERELSKHLNVSRVTLKSALGVLEKDRWLEPSELRRKRKIKKSKRRQSGKSEAESGIAPLSTCQGKTVIYVGQDEFTNSSPLVRTGFMNIEANCKKAGINLKYAAMKIWGLKRPGSRIKGFLRNHPADLYLLVSYTRESQAWFARNKVPCLLTGTPWPENDLPYVTWNQVAMGQHTGAMLARLGHSKVGIVGPPMPSYATMLYIKGIKEAYPDIIVVDVPAGDNPDDLSSALKSLFVAGQQNQPTVIILISLFHVVTTMNILLSIGIKVPRDLSVLSVYYDELLRHFIPAVASYRIKSGLFHKAISEQIVSCLRYPETKTRAGNDGKVQGAWNIRLIPDYVTAPSLGKAPGVDGH